MAWVRISDNAPRHPRIIGLSDAAFRLWTEALCWAGEFLTDGRIDPAALKRLANPDAAPELVSAGLWIVDGEIHQIRDYLDYQPSREKVLRDRAADAARKAKRGPHGASRRVQTDSGGIPDGIRPESGKIPDAPSHPIPITKDLSSSDPLTEGYPQAVDDEERTKPASQIIAERRAALRPDLRNPSGWQHKVAASLSDPTSDDGGELARVAAAHPDWTAEQLADAVELPPGQTRRKPGRVDCDWCHGSGWLPETDPARRCDHTGAAA